MIPCDPPERVDVPTGGPVPVEPRTALQSANHGAHLDPVAYDYGTPPGDEHAHRSSTRRYSF